jgi:hypothetical protein
MLGFKYSYTTTSEQMPLVNNHQPESPALLNLQCIFLVFWIFGPTSEQRPPSEQRPLFGGSQGWPLYTDLTVNFLKHLLYVWGALLVLGDFHGNMEQGRQ